MHGLPYFLAESDSATCNRRHAAYAVSEDPLAMLAGLEEGRVAHRRGRRGALASRSGPDRRRTDAEGLACASAALLRVESNPEGPLQVRGRRATTQQPQISPRHPTPATQYHLISPRHPTPGGDPTVLRPNTTQHERSLCRAPVRAPIDVHSLL